MQWADWLDEFRHLQIRGHYSGLNGGFCATAILKVMSPPGLSDGDSLVMTNAVYRWADMRPITDGAVINWNDDERLTFPQIAKRIREQWRDL